MINKVTGKSRAFVFVEFATPAEAAKVVKRFHGKDFQGRPHTGNIPRRAAAAAVAVMRKLAASAVSVRLFGLPGVGRNRNTARFFSSNEFDSHRAEL